MPSQPNDTASTNCEPDSVGAYAALLDKSVVAVLALLQEAGVEKIHASDRLSEREKSQLLEHLLASLGISNQPNRVVSCLPYAHFAVIRSMGTLVPFDFAVHRRMAEMLKQLRKLIKQALHSVFGPTLQERSFSAMQKRGGRSRRHASVYFHTLKVDGRNLP